MKPTLKLFISAVLATSLSTTVFADTWKFASEEDIAGTALTVA